MTSKLDDLIENSEIIEYQGVKAFAKSLVDSLKGEIKSALKKDLLEEYPITANTKSEDTEKIMTCIVDFVSKQYMERIDLAFDELRKEE